MPGDRTAIGDPLTDSVTAIRRVETCIVILYGR